MPNYTKEEINNLLKEIKKLKEYELDQQSQIDIKNRKFKELINIYNSRVKNVKDTRFTTLVNTAVSKMESLQNAQKGFAKIQKNLLNSISYYQKNTNPKLKKQITETNNKISQFETMAKENEARLKELQKKEQLSFEEQENLESLEKLSLDPDHKKELENLKKVVTKSERQLKEVKSQVSKLKTTAQKEAGVATLKSLCNAVWNKNKNTGLFAILTQAWLFISSNAKSDKIKTSEIQAVIDSLSEKNYHKGFVESYNRINDVASFDSSKIDGNIDIAVKRLRADAETYYDQTNQSMEKIKSQINKENIEKHGISFAFKKFKEAKAIRKKRKEALKSILASLKAYCSCESNDSKMMESLTQIAQCIFLFETLKYSSNSIAIPSSGGVDWLKGFFTFVIMLVAVIIAAVYLAICVLFWEPLAGIIGAIVLIAFAVFICRVWWKSNPEEEMNTEGGNVVEVSEV